MAACVAACAAKTIAATTTTLGPVQGGNGEILAGQWIPKSGVKVPLLARGLGHGQGRGLGRGLGLGLVWRREVVRRASVRRIGVSCAQVELEPEVESLESSDNGAVVLGIGGEVDTGESVVVEGASNGAANARNGAVVKGVVTGNVATNGSAYSNGAAAYARSSNGAAQAAVDEVGGTEFVSKVESIEQEEPWFKRGDSQNAQVSVAPGGRWNRFKTYSTIQRTLEIWGFVITFVFKWWLNNQKFMYRGGVTELKKHEKRKALAKWLKEGLLRLGPTFIKIGQQFSTRVDILPKEYVDELAELQDQVPPFDSETAVSIVEEELGRPVDLIFDRFDRDPVAAASLGQVHRARLRGKEIVVKVQRPGLKDLFDIDLKNLRVIAENLQKVDPKSDGAKRDWVAIYDECASVLYEEIDYTKEATNAEKFQLNFKDIPYIKVPSIIRELSTAQILTMEYVPGIKINRTAALDELGVDRKMLARFAVESYLEQILRHGFFHADPHPGNIAVDDVNGGRLIFYDFGMMGSINPNIREGLLEVFYGVYEKTQIRCSIMLTSSFRGDDTDGMRWVLQAMVQMGVLVPSSDLTAVRRTAQYFLNTFEERLAAQRAEREEIEAEEKKLGFKRQLSREEKAEKKKQRLAAIGEDLLSIGADQPFRFPATFTFVVRAFSVLDGIGKGLDPRFDISEIAKPYALELLRFREAGVEVVFKDFKKRWDRQAQAFSNVFRQADRVEKIANMIQRLEQGELKLRVRVLESERAFKRVATMQQTIGQAVLAATCLQLATMLHLSTVMMPATAAFTCSAIFGLQTLVGIMKVRMLDKQEKLITGKA